MAQVVLWLWSDHMSVPVDDRCEKFGGEVKTANTV